MTDHHSAMRCYIVDGLRTPIGKFGGNLSHLASPALGGALVREFIRRGRVDPDYLDQVIFGNVLQAGIGMNPARQAAVEGGVPFSTPAYTVNMVCASGLQAIVLGDQAVRYGQAHTVIAGGFESMSRAPRILESTRWGKPLGHVPSKDVLLTDGLWDVFYDCHMAMTVEQLIERYAISREAQDEFALQSHLKAIKAREAGLLESEVMSIEADGKMIKEDEGPRSDTSFAKLALLKPAFLPEGTITAGNASGLNDGAAAVVLSADKPTEGSLCAEVISSALVGVDPIDMGIAPAFAIDKLLRQTKIRMADIGLWELNEAFAGQMLAVLREISVPESLLNVNGGAIALGHPIGCSGARILVSLLHEMRRRKVELGVAALCVGGGLGLAVLVRAIHTA
jgi:acetyl-CoA C-acetyltransferase